MLLHRFLAAIFLSLLLIGAMCGDYYWLKDSLLLHVLFLVGSSLCFREFWSLCRSAGLQTFSNWGTISGCVLICAHYWTLRTATEDRTFEGVFISNNILNAAIVAAVFGAFVITARRRDYAASLGGLGVTCFGLIYIWFMPSFVLKLRYLGENGLVGGSNWNLFGTKMVVATIVVAKGCDVAAYLIGRWKGKRKAFPMLSPGKTVEGLAAGLIGSSLFALLLRIPQLNVLPADKFSIFQTLIFGLLIGFSGMMGDLAESILKRSAGVKDSSHMVPGYGGIMDVADSLVVAGPVAYFLVPAIIS